MTRVAWSMRFHRSEPRFKVMHENMERRNQCPTGKISAKRWLTLQEKHATLGTQTSIFIMGSCIDYSEPRKI